MAFMLGITPWPVASALLWIVLIVSALYLARATAHKAIQAMARAFHRGFRTASKAVARSQENLAARNRDVLLAAGREAKERVIEREFDRINDTVRKDLGNYSALHRSLDESIKRIEDDHQQSVNVPPDPPGWVEAVKAIAKIDEREGRFGVGNILSDIHKSLVKAHKEAMTAYVSASKQRHQLLKEMRPDWRAIQKTLARVGKNVDSLLARSVTIDRLMQEYRADRRDRRRGDQLLVNRTADGGDGWRHESDRWLQDGRHCRTRHHHGGDLDGALPDGVAAHYAPVPGHRCAARQSAGPHGGHHVYDPVAARKRRGRARLHA
jgi:hypothetical protein